MLLAGPAAAQQTLIRGIDHTPVVVADLEKAQADFRLLGFAIKPGRPHDDGIRNAHVKFRDGSEVELITPPSAVDALTTEYRAKLDRGEGPVYFGLYAPDRTELASRLQAAGVAGQQDGFGFFSRSPLHPLFFGMRNKSPTDRPEHFAHPNTALRLSGLWIRGRAEEQDLLAKLDVPLKSVRACGPLRGEAMVASFPEGEIMFVRPQPQTGDVIGARIEVRSLASLRALLWKNGVKTETYAACDRKSVWVSPALAHGIWLQFVEVR